MKNNDHKELIEGFTKFCNKFAKNMPANEFVIKIAEITTLIALHHSPNALEAIQTLHFGIDLGIDGHLERQEDRAKQKTTAPYEKRRGEDEV